MLRRPALPAALAAAALLLAARPAPAPAAAIIPQATSGAASYELANTSAAGTPAITKVIASIIPPGTVSPPDPATSPLTILPGSKGFDQSNLKVLLGEGKSPSGDPIQALALDFGSAGLASGGVLDFALNLDKSFKSSPQLQLPVGTTGLTIKQLTADTKPEEKVSSTSTPGSGSGGGNNAANHSSVSVAPVTPVVMPQNQVPEPLTLVVWSAGVLGFGLVRARAHRRSRRPARSA